MGKYKFDTPEAAYKEAQRRIWKAKTSFFKDTSDFDLSGLGLIEVPPEIGQLIDLTKLHLNGNQITGIPSEISQLVNLTLLDLNNNQVATIPAEISQLTQLEVLWLDNNLLTSIPSEIAKLTNLTRLHLSHNQLSILPPEITQLINLTWLGLSHNLLASVLSEIAQLTNLTMLHLNNNQITDVSPKIIELASLTALWLHNNKLKIIPSEIAQLSQLEVLNLRNNQIRTIPPEFTQLANLRELDLRDNQLMAVPSEITQLKKLKYLNLTGNVDLSIPPEIVASYDHPQAILDYLRDQEVQFTRPLDEAKLIFVGQGSVGKTSLVKRIVANKFSAHEEQTKGINIKKWQLDVPRPAFGTAPITLHIWDFGGQEIMHATHQFFLTKRSLYILVLDARQDEDEGRIEYWLSLINSFAANAPILIVINKIDQNVLDIDRRGLQKKYPSIQDFISTSARDGIGIDELKDAIRHVLSKMEHLGTLFPIRWMLVKEELVSMQNNHDYISFNEYQKLCQNYGIYEESSQNTLIRFLHDLGIALNFNDDDRVRETSVLNPRWVTEGVYTLLNSPVLQKQQGTLRREQLRDTLSSTTHPTAQERNFLVEMMLKFELAFELPDRQGLLVPDLISKEEPEFEWSDDDALLFAYQYHVLPRSILHRFMVRQHHLVDAKIRWRTGVLLHYDSFSALVKADIKAGIIRIAITGDGDRRQFLYSLRSTFAGIHESITGAKPQEVVPIPGYPDAPPIAYSYLEKLEKMNRPDQQLFPGMDEVLSVQKLLNGVSTSAMRQVDIPSRQKVANDLRVHFNEDEFYELLFDLDVDRDDLEGNTVNAKKVSCVVYMERRGRLAELVKAIQERRP